MRCAEQSGTVVTFTESDHSYRDNRGGQYRSVTQIVNSLFPKFDADGNALRVALREGTTKEDVLARWKQAGNESRETGTAAHALAEAIFLGQDLPQPKNERERHAFKLIWDATSRLKSIWKHLIAEALIFSEQYRIAGQVDEIMIENGTVQAPKVWIIDWKTNKEISRNNYGRFASAPIAHVPDHNFAKYTLQLRLYERIILDEKILAMRGVTNPATDCGIVHVPPSAAEPIWIPVPRCDAEIDAIIKHHVATFNVPRF